MAFGPVEPSGFVPNIDETLTVKLCGRASLGDALNIARLPNLHCAGHALFPCTQSAWGDLI